MHLHGVHSAGHTYPRPSITYSRYRNQVPCLGTVSIVTRNKSALSPGRRQNTTLRASHPRYIYTYTHTHIYIHYLAIARYFIFFSFLCRASLMPHSFPLPSTPPWISRSWARLHLRPGLLSAYFLFWSVWPPPTADLGCHTLSVWPLDETIIRGIARNGPGNASQMRTHTKALLRSAASASTSITNDLDPWPWI